MLCKVVEDYLNNAMGLPFFYAVGDNDYKFVLDELKQRELEPVRVSDFCKKDDKFPDFDELVDFFRTADVDYRTNRFVLIGLGEYLLLRGGKQVESKLREFKTTTLGNARVVLLLRGVADEVHALATEDIRLEEQKRVYVSENTNYNLSATNIKLNVGTVTQSGVKWLLRQFEDGATENCEFSSVLAYEESVIKVASIESAYAVLKYRMADFMLCRNYGTENQWSQLLAVLDKTGYDLEKLFENYGLDENYEEDIEKKAGGLELKNWLFFISLKMHPERIKNAYLSYVTQETESFDELKDNIAKGITAISHADTRFMRLYEERKKLVRNFSDSEIAVFIKENEIDPQEEIYHYTDTTLIERKRVLSWVSKNGWEEEFAYIYPALTAYLKKYIFDCGSISDVLTEYFEQYKKQKVENYLASDFLILVEKYATNPVYAKLPTRDEVINALEDKNNTYLYWMDALGVEYLSYINELARGKGLSIHVEVVRADLPTITTINKSFYEEWSGKKKYKEEALDDTKHKAKGGYFFADSPDATEEPIHLAKELEIIERAIDIAAMELAMHNCKKFVIASDHGASRLAVLRKKEEKYETDTSGEHSGRCCKVFDNCDLNNKIQENGYFVLTDYGRFKGSRRANVEVHGGATLEEIVVPVITLKLKRQVDVKIKILNADKLQADRKLGTTVLLYISYVENMSNVSLVVNGSKYRASCDDSTHYTIVLEDIRRSKKCGADVYDGDDLIGNIKLDIKGKSGNVDAEFDAEFNF
ncbi:BREX-4 system phosphatase PglZ [[Clostridium] hylemonae]|uniref:BREX-4 system phosphatase PglZ n=1 Tax=[Clostridium] hylemonae TaxID=89153 RepID=UPI00110727DE|nr:BREX-4 system phosphatase PglZ [[Clostridium] hylemonae]